MCDAPPHGSQHSGFKSDSVSIKRMQDNELTEQIFDRMREMGIEYHFGRGNDSTDVMIEIFLSILGYETTAFDVRDPIRVTESVVAASAEARSKRIEQTLSESMGKKKEFTSVKSLLVWPRLSIQQGWALKYKEPQSINEIRDYRELDEATRQIQVKIAPFPFEKYLNYTTFSENGQISKWSFPSQKSL